MYILACDLLRQNENEGSLVQKELIIEAFMQAI